MSSKEGLTLPGYHREPQTAFWKRGFTFLLLSLLGLVFVARNHSVVTELPQFSPIRTAIQEAGWTWGRPHEPDSLCPLVRKVNPQSILYNNLTLDTILHDKTFREDSLKKLWDSIKVPTQVYDDQLNPNSADSLTELYKIEPRWKPYEDFHKYLETTFPLVHKHLQVEKVNKFALVYTWKGSSDKKPILLTAHMDVVPIQDETVDQWKYPPFEGGYDGKYLYGRGVLDCKDLLIGLLHTAELLLEEDQFKPERTIIFGFGYDEESVGTGAAEISKHLTERYGPDSFYALIDEGNSGYVDVDDNTRMLIPATGEKGHLDSLIEIFTPGGHSSIPPRHTLIGILSRLISKIEDAEFESVITNNNPVLNGLQCMAEYSSLLDKKLKSDILRAHFDAGANKKVLEYLNLDRILKYMVTTSQAVDIIGGGVKSNALPEHASVLVNHRIAIEESVASTRNKVVNQMMEAAEEYGLGLVVDGNELKPKTKQGHFVYTTSEPLEPAPITPLQDETWNVYGGALRYLYEDLLFPHENKTYVVAPFISTGNTDTKSYWDLTRNIYRYEPGFPDAEANAHSVDERLEFDAHLLVIAFYYYYLQVVDVLADE